jgi:hypothetical protein
MTRFRQESQGQGKDLPGAWKLVESLWKGVRVVNDAAVSAESQVTSYTATPMSDIISSKDALQCGITFTMYYCRIQILLCGGFVCYSSDDLDTNVVESA